MTAMDKRMMCVIGLAVASAEFCREATWLPSPVIATQAKLSVAPPTLAGVAPSQTLYTCVSAMLAWAIYTCVSAMMSCARGICG